MYEAGSGKSLQVDETVYLPAENKLLLSVTAPGLQSLACDVRLKNGITYTNGNSAEGTVAGTLVPAFPCRAFDVSVAALRFFDGEENAVIKPAPGEFFKTKITVINSANEDKTGTLALFVKGREDSPLISDNVTVEAGKTKVFTYTSDGVFLEPYENLSASFTE